MHYNVGHKNLYTHSFPYAFAVAIILETKKERKKYPNDKTILKSV